MNYVEFRHLLIVHPYALLFPRPHSRIPLLVQTNRRQKLARLSQEAYPKKTTCPPGIARSAAQVHEALGRKSLQSLHSPGHVVDSVTSLGKPVSFQDIKYGHKVSAPTLPPFHGPKDEITDQTPAPHPGTLKFRRAHFPGPSTQTQHTPPMDNAPASSFATRHATTLATTTTVIVRAVPCSTCLGK